MPGVIKFFKHEAFLKYALTGAVVTVFELGLLYWLIEANNWWYLYASSLSFFGGLVVSFFLRKIIVFKNHDWSALPHQLFLYSLVWLIDIVINAGLMYVLVDYTKMGYLLSQILSNVLLGLFGFTFNRLVVFKNLAEAQAEMLQHQLIEEIEK